MNNNEHLHQLQHRCSGIHKRNRSLDRFFKKEDKRREAVAIAQRVDEYGGVWLEVLDEQEASNDEHIGKCSLVELVKSTGALLSDGMGWQPDLGTQQRMEVCRISESFNSTASSRTLCCSFSTTTWIP
ncbi:unnamed protein product [Sphagnum jensenii]|uniref:Uncharacterized protein n=1 Tax=Sphagnum jensenii TaxID=128206 RepID=A0ABP0X1I5_9BRYO